MKLSNLKYIIDTTLSSISNGVYPEKLGSIKILHCLKYKNWTFINLFYFMISAINLFYKFLFQYKSVWSLKILKRTQHFVQQKGSKNIRSILTFEPQSIDYLLFVYEFMLSGFKTNHTIAHYTYVIIFQFEAGNVT